MNAVNQIPLPQRAKPSTDTVIETVLHELALAYPNDIANTLSFSKRVGIPRTTIINIKRKIFLNWEIYGPQVLALKERNEREGS